MRVARALAAGLLLAACAKGPEVLPPNLRQMSTYSLPRDEPGRVPSRDLRGLAKDTTALESTLGRYPARFADDDARGAAYGSWSDLLLDARVLTRPADGVEFRMWILGELYRMGHNLDVRGAVQLADDNLSACVAQFPESTLCNGSLIDLYLSVKPTDQRLERVERSLEALRKSLGPGEDEVVDAEYVHLRLVQRDAPAAQRAIDDYLAKFPQGHYAEQFRHLRPTLDREIEDPSSEAEP